MPKVVVLRESDMASENDYIILEATHLGAPVYRIRSHASCEGHSTTDFFYMHADAARDFVLKMGEIFGHETVYLREPPA